jgi:predicted GNAT superfamily acetyltransferase
MSVVVRAALPADFPAICTLNLAEVQHTSAMDVARLTHLDALSCHHRVVCCDGVVSAFLLAICSGASYKNENFEWFAKKYPRFMYVDRIVVSAAARGKRLGSLLYEDLFHQAKLGCFPFITCEYNLSPPNEASKLFHDKFGFEEQGSQWVANGAKRVSLQAASTQSNA